MQEQLRDGWRALLFAITVCQRKSYTPLAQQRIACVGGLTGSFMCEQFVMQTCGPI